MSKNNKGFGVAASPFNPVKLELGVILILAVLVLLGAHTITNDDFTQLLMLLAFGIVASVWLVARVRAVSRCQSDLQQNSDNAKKQS